MTGAERLYNRGVEHGELLWILACVMLGRKQREYQLVRDLQAMHYEPEIIVRLSKMSLEEVQKIMSTV